MCLQLRNDHSDNCVIVRGKEAEIAPLVQEVPVDVDAVGLTEVRGDEGSYGREEGRLEVGGVAGVDYFRGGGHIGLGGRSGISGRGQGCGEAGHLVMGAGVVGVGGGGKLRERARDHVEKVGLCSRIGSFEAQALGTLLQGEVNVLLINHPPGCKKFTDMVLSRIRKKINITFIHCPLSCTVTHTNTIPILLIFTLLPHYHHHFRDFFRPSVQSQCICIHCLLRRTLTFHILLVTLIYADHGLEADSQLVGSALRCTQDFVSCDMYC